MDSTSALIQKLKSNKSLEVYNALAEIRKSHAKNLSKKTEKEKHSLIEAIISLIEHPKHCNISLSIIADACLDEICVAKVIECNGVKSLARIMKSLVNCDIQNRACRAIGNIAKCNKSICKEIHSEEIVSDIITFLDTAKKNSCKHTAIRTLRILGERPKTREIIENKNGILYIAKVLSDKDLLSCSTQALTVLTENCSEFCASQVIEAQLLKTFVDLYRQSGNDIKANIMKSLQNVSHCESVRSDLVKAGAVKLFSEVSIDGIPLESRKMAIKSLCNCLNYMHMFPNYGTSNKNGLIPLVKTLKLKELRDVHCLIFSSLFPLMFEQDVVDILVDLEFINISTEMLKSFLLKHKTDHVTFLGFFNEDIEFPFSQKKNNSNINDKSYESHCFEKDKVFKSDNLTADCVKISNSYNFNTVAETHLVGNKSFPHSRCFNSDGSSCSSPSCGSPSSSGSTSLSPRFSPDYTQGWPKTIPSTYSAWPPLEAEDSPSYSPVENFYSDDETIDIPSPIENIFIEEQLSSKTSTVNKRKCHSLLNEDHSFSDYHKTCVLNKEDTFSCEGNLQHKIDTVRDNVNKKSTVAFNLTQEKGNKKIKTSNQIYQNNQSVKEKHFSISKKSGIKRLDSLILSLLFRLLFYLEKKSNSELANKSCFSVLLYYIFCVEDANLIAKRIILELLKNRYCFEKLIINGFVLKMEQIFELVYNSDTCKHCSRIHSLHQDLIATLSKETESDYGIGTICHILCTAEKPSQFHAIYAVSKLVYRKTSLYKALVQANGLNLIYEFLSDTSDKFSKQAIVCLCQIYQNLNKTSKVKYLEKCCISKTCSLNLTSRCVYKNDLLDLTFVVDGGASICASREKICDNSEYFNALLKGYFSESNKSVVEISGISAETLSAIFHFLHGCFSSEYCPYIKRIPFEVSLQLLSECEKYLLHEIKSFVEDRICHSFFPETVSKVYQIAKTHNSNKLFKKALHYALCLDVTETDVLLTCFFQFMKLENFHVLDDIKDLIENVLET